MYNAEQTITKCLNSIILQTYTNFEVIIVDDGSTDGSYECSLKIINGDRRFKIIRQPNSGVSKARNRGIENCSGEFICFVDSDDWLEADALETLVNNSEDVDMVFSNFYYEYENNFSTIGIISQNRIKKDHIRSYPLGILVPETTEYYDGVTVSAMGAACGKLVRRSIITENHLSFNEKLPLGEDGLFHLQCFLHSNDIIILSKPTYHYLQLGTSAIHRYRPDVHENCNLEFYNSFLSEAGRIDDKFKDEYKELISYRCYLSLISLFVFNEYNNLSFLKKYKLLRQYLRNSSIYDIKGHIPKSIHFAKQVELLFLKHKVCSMLILLYYIRKKIKSK